MSFTLRQIRYFVAVSEAGSITHAAANVYISPSSVTEAVKELEEDLGVKLFERKRSGLSLTYEGYLFLRSSKKILSAVSDAKHSLKSISSNVSGSITIGTSVTVSGYFIANTLERFRRSFPNISITLKEYNRVVNERKVRNHEIDAAVILVSNVKERKGLKLLTLMSSSRQLWLSVDNPLCKNDIVSLDEIAQYPYIQLLIDEAHQTTQNYWKSRGMKPNTIFKSSSVEAVRSMVGTGSGITILSDMVYRPWSLEGDRIETRPVKEKIPDLNTGVVWSNQRSQSEALEAFINFCRLEYTTGGSNKNNLK